MSVDITIRRGRHRACVAAMSDLGTAWIKDNVQTPDGFDYMIDNDLVGDVQEDMERDGLKVEVT